MPTIFQQLGAFIENTGNCTDVFLKSFYDVGGRWAAVKLYDESPDQTVYDNLQSFERGYGDHMRSLGIQPALWSNFRHDYNLYAESNSRLFHQFNLKALILDVEAEAKADEIQIPGSTADERYQALGNILHAQRRLNPLAPIGISSYGSPFYTLDWHQLHEYQARYLPQWYYNYDPKFDPTLCIQEWLRLKYGPKSYVHGTISNMEGHSIQQGIQSIRKAQVQGLFLKGFQIYTLENTMPDGFAQLDQAHDLFFS